MGTATLPFSEQLYENQSIVRRHRLSHSAGVFTPKLVAVSSSVTLSRQLTLQQADQRSLAESSNTTPFS
ncbi:LrgB family protein, partial [Erwinia amylovora]|nr:LrgB family protein [Erwinia amylovora]